MCNLMLLYHSDLQWIEKSCATHFSKVISKVKKNSTNFQSIRKYNSTEKVEKVKDQFESDLIKSFFKTEILQV